MLRGKCKNISNRFQCDLAISEPSSPTIASPGYTNTPEKQDSDLKSHLMKMIEKFKEDINSSLKEIQENIIQLKELKKTVQDLKIEIATIKKKIRKGDNPGDGKSRKEVRNNKCKHHQQNTREKRESLRCRR
jgi:septal ring factor EnvC (AmiA/AmiB activator)